MSEVNSSAAGGESTLAEEVFFGRDAVGFRKAPVELVPLRPIFFGLAMLAG